MESSLLTQLTKIVSFSGELREVLLRIRGAGLGKYGSNCLKQMDHHLVSLTCQTKNLLHYKYLEDRAMHRQCLSLILDILLQHANQHIQSESYILSLFMSHILSHPSCYISYSCMYLLVLSGLPSQHPSLDRVRDLNLKIIKEFKPRESKLLNNFKIAETDTFTVSTLQDCQDNLNTFLSRKSKPFILKKPKQKNNTLVINKIPPLLLPTSKSINSSRYSAASKEEKPKGLSDLRKLAYELGEGFISVELGCLLSNKRTQQVHQFSENLSYRKRCMDKIDQIETERMSTSGFSLIDEPFLRKEEELQQNHYRYYQKVLILNMNLIYRRLQDSAQNKKTVKKHQRDQTKSSSIQQKEMLYYIKQIIDMGMLGMLGIGSGEKHEEKEGEGVFQMAIRGSDNIENIVKWMMRKVSEESEKIHHNLLINKGKEGTPCHFDVKQEEVIAKDGLLNKAEVVRNKPKEIKGGWKVDEKEKWEIKKYSDPVLLYIGRWLSSILKSGDLDDPLLMSSMTHLLQILSFYLSSASKITPFMAMQFMLPIFIQIKRFILQLSHPCLQCTSPHQLPLVRSYPQFFQYYLQSISYLTINNKYIERVIGSVFIRNVQFMEIVEQFTRIMFEEEKFGQVLSILGIYKRWVDTLCQRKVKNNENKMLKAVMEHITGFMGPGGCIRNALDKYQPFLSPQYLQDEPRQHPAPLFHFLHHLLSFISHIFYMASPTTNDSPSILNDDVATYYIKYSIMNFIKLYSLITVNELANISENSPQEQIMTTKESPHALPKTSTKKVLMIELLRVLRNISINRNPQLSKKFRQYRVLQFFVRELELQFSVTQNIQKYIQKSCAMRDVPISSSSASSAQRHKSNSPQNPKVPILTGHIFKTQASLQPKSKQQKASQPKGKNLVPSLSLPIKKQDNHEQRTRSKACINEGDSSKEKVKFGKGELNLEISQLKRREEGKDSWEGKVRDRQDGKAKDSSERNLIYWTQRKVRKLYSSRFLHAEALLLVFSLLLYKGLLDPLYCDRFPITEGKMNVLYILHYHLNHPSNRSIIPLLSESVSKIKPYLSGQRLLKLLCNSFTDMKYYKNWSKINSGAYGVIYAAETQFYEPKEVAIKEMSFPKSIYERCVLHDIFTEITALEMFRLDPSVTRMYNYGVVDNTYFIVMKKYTCSVRDWRIGKINHPSLETYPPNLPNILSVYHEILKVVKILHQQNVIHYDIKADNIMMEVNEERVEVAFGDFGEAKIYQLDEEQLDVKSRGTECIKSPEMLTIAIKNKKEADHYDRRKKVGTTKASDIWSLACLLYELLTAEYLFHRNDWVNFYIQVTSPQEELLTQSNCEKLNHSIYLIDFLKYMLIRDPNHRPSIQNVISRFENLYSLLVTNTQKLQKMTPLYYSMQKTEEMVQDYIKLINQQGESMRQARLKTEGQTTTREGVKSSTKLLRIMEDIYFCENLQSLVQHPNKLKEENITHVIGAECLSALPSTLCLFQLNINGESLNSIAYRLCPRVSDFLKQVLLLKGKLLFINNHTNYAISLLVFTLSYWFRCSAYETWCLINTQILSFPSNAFNLVKISKLLSKLNCIERSLQKFPKLQCICGSVTLIMRRYPDKKNECKICKCKKRTEISQCYSSGCGSYVEWLKKRYNISWDHLKWGSIQSTHLMTTFTKAQTAHESMRTQLLLNSGQPHQNLSTVEIELNGWKLYQCRVCDMWMLATNDTQVKIILNNLIKSTRQGIMIPNAQQDFKARTPSLNYYTLSKLHMTSQ